MIQCYTLIVGFTPGSAAWGAWQMCSLSKMMKIILKNHLKTWKWSKGHKANEGIFIQEY